MKKLSLIGALALLFAAVAVNGGAAAGQGPGDGLPSLEDAIERIGTTPCGLRDPIDVGRDLLLSSDSNGLLADLPIAIDGPIELQVVTDTSSLCELFSDSAFWLVAIRWEAADPSFVATSFNDGQTVAGIGEQAVIDSDTDGRFVLDDFLVSVTNIPPGHAGVSTDRAVTIDLMRSTAAAMYAALGIDGPPPGVSGPQCNDLSVTVDMAMNQVPTDGDDVIRGTAGDDVIDGLGGNDTICSLQGDDVIDGGDGFDKIFAGDGNDTVNGGSGNDRMVGGSGNDRMTGGAGNDRAFGGPGRDMISGGRGVDRLAGGTGNDVIRGEQGADELLGNQGRDELSGGDGPDILRGGAWIDTLDGGNNTNDACSTIAEETRINCERGLFGLQ